MRWKTGAGIVVLMLLLWGLTGPHFMMSPDKSTYSPGEEPKLTIRNVGLTPVYFGQGYLIYRWENGSWVGVRTPFIFIDMLYDLPPFHSWRQGVTLKYLPENESPGEPRPYPDLPPGRYRLVKEICGPFAGCRNASVEFEIKG
ncbi:hypothetical protein GQS_00815 [Thermococcus sp. 4557]|uniref:immunoglobulin-like domain-containing protein n=1 Tax=Thermococcus sp. (strain CGMCC 1.5172 / 4557) TaxID=1042877 RepID=UPI000219E962|nr:immunoglobulin-like domain-containing protein [Thermococcus sp. 4557]AEK72066.1 hypothetical protein GQS_00815 [Thermococcus sp. 4557]